MKCATTSSIASSIFFSSSDSSFFLKRCHELTITFIFVIILKSAFEWIVTGPEAETSATKTILWSLSAVLHCPTFSTTRQSIKSADDSVNALEEVKLILLVAKKAYRRGITPFTVLESLWYALWHEFTVITAFDSLLQNIVSFQYSTRREV